MSGDYSRSTFDPWRHFSGVLMQQGRVALDADWNELVAMVGRRLRAEAVDTLGRAVVPRETPEGFAVTIGGSGDTKTMTIGRGRIYVHGHLAENHGAPPLMFDLAAERPDGSGPLGVLAETIGTEPVSYTAQPHFPSPPSLPAGDGPHLVYLDVWQREVTAVEDRSLLESALGGVDTTTRMQTVWQVRVLPDVGGGATCATADADLPGWSAETAPSAGRLTSRAVTPEDPDDPCLIAPGGGYSGLENQLYRVEIHDRGTIGIATFKWSRDNATVASAVLDIPSPDTLTVTRIGRDAVLRFNVNDWVEITDDVRELSGRPGEMRKVQGINEETRRLTLSSPLPADLVPSGAGDDAPAGRHTRVRRWDQGGVVRDADGAVIVDLDAPGTAGVIPVPAAGTFVVLEKGVQVGFATSPVGGAMRAMDFWTFAARTADASVVELEDAPPQGLYHHYCRLAVVTFPATVLDCRTFWPPEFAGEGCACSVCVTPDGHNSGAATIQMAVDRVRETGGTICLAVGEYALGGTPVVIDGASSVRVVGQGWRTLLFYTGVGPAVSIRNGLGVTVEDLTVLTPPGTDLADRGLGGGSAFHLRHNIGITVRRCVAVQFGSRAGGRPAISIEGALLGAVFEQNALLAPVGVGGAIEQERSEQRIAYSLVADVTIRDNVLASGRAAVSFAGFSLHVGDTRITRNTMLGGTEGAVVTTGMSAPGSRIAVEDNVIWAAGDGVVTGVDHTRVRRNDIAWMSAGSDNNRLASGSGVVVAQGLRVDRVDDCGIEDNRVAGAPEAGIVVRQRIGAARLAGNSIVDAGRAAIVMAAESGAADLAIVDNRFEDILPLFDDDTEPAVAINLVDVERLQFSRNTVRRIAPRAVRSPGRIAVLLHGCRECQVTGNTVVEIGPREGFRDTVAILAVSPLGALHVRDSAIVRSDETPIDRDMTPWYGVRVLAGASERLPPIRAGSVGYPLFILADGPAYAINRFSIRVLAERAEPAALIEGNSITAWGQSPLVQVVLGGTCLFTANSCLMSTQSQAQAVVQIAARRSVVSNNVVRRPSDQDAIQLQGKAFTVLGNITFGNIRVDGNALPPPWQDLNILSS